ncbi:TerD family protein [Candidatus Epulonipiscium viviparus]|uniref:TerD family protein n=1 Tax=Candidatus Epulonipiscium viviparus TaxID=420336 RepID=UPI0027381271|nr:TerD family protein [Candidatus Epulopiscium viviparus]
MFNIPTKITSSCHMDDLEDNFMNQLKGSSNFDNIANNHKSSSKSFSSSKSSSSSSFSDYDSSSSVRYGKGDPTDPTSAQHIKSSSSSKRAGVTLQKGQRYNLSQANPDLDSIYVGLGWDLPTHSAIPYDLDAEVFMLGSNNRVLSDDWFIFYGQKNSPDGSCIHLADSTTGAEIGDDEIIHIQLSKVNSAVKKIAIVITINDAIINDQKFGDVKNAYVRVIDQQNRKEIMKFNLTDYASNVRSLTVGEIYRKDNSWRFNAVGQGLDTDLAGLCKFYGVNLA